MGTSLPFVFCLIPIIGPYMPMLANLYSKMQHMILYKIYFHQFGRKGTAS